MPLKTRWLVSPTSRLAKQQDNTTTTTARKPNKCLARPHASQDKNARKRKGSQANNACLPRPNDSQTQWLASPNTASQDLEVPTPSLESQKRKKHASQGRTARKSNKSHLHGSQPTNTPLPAKQYRYPPACTQNVLGYTQQAGCTRYPGVQSTSTDTKPGDLCQFLPMPYRFRNPKFFPCPPLSLFPGFCPILALSPSRLFPGSWLSRTSRSFVTFGDGAAYGGRRGGWGGRSKVRLTTGGAGGGSTMRLTVAQRGLCRCLQVISINVQL